MRLFVAIPIPEDLARSLAEARRSLEQRLPGARWVEPQNLHLTLKFLGEVAEERAVRAAEALRRALQNAPAFRLELAGLGAFPSEKAPRVIWAGVGAGRPELEALADGVRGALAAFGGGEDDKPFQPHLTLGRWKAPPERGVPPWRPAGTPLFGDCRVDRVCLMQSRLFPDGPAYRVLRQYPLKEAL